MQNRNIIIILIVVIVILIAAMGIMLSLQMAKEESNLSIAHKKINAGDSLVFVLKDSHGNPLSNEKVHIKLTKNGKSVTDKDIKTNSKGKAKYTVDDDGKYSVECSFKGNDEFASTSVIDNITVQKATTKMVGQEQTSTATHSSKYASNGGIYPEYGPDVDSYGHTREYAIANDMHYIELTIDGKTVGGYTAIDPNTGTYHT